MTTHLVIFGATGDLAARKLIPALYNLCLKDRLAEDIEIVATARRPFTDATIRKEFEADTKKFSPDNFDAGHWAKFAKRIHYVRLDMTEKETHEALADYLQTRPGNALFYLSVAPNFYADIVAILASTGLNVETDGWRRIVIEKPFGYDLASARALNERVHSAFDESQVYRIDHYLGKETAQNILFFRFANILFEPIWNRNYIDSVYITVAEDVDVADRAEYYDEAGVVRDMFQNHLLQLVMLTAMEAPTSFDADIVRNEKVKVLHAIPPVLLYETVRAQYSDYRQTKGVAEGSETPTFAQIQLFIDNWRWQGVPFYLRSGKALKQKASEIAIRFKRPPHLMFQVPEDGLKPNILAIRLQPDEGIHLRFEAKVPDEIQAMRSVDMEFAYAQAFPDVAIPDSYQRLILDALNGDPTLFTRSDEIEAAWQIIDPIIQGWTTPSAPPLAFYERGTWGPSEASEALELDGRSWQLYCEYGDC